MLCKIIHMQFCNNYFVHTCQHMIEVNCHMFDNLIACLISRPIFRCLFSVFLVVFLLACFLLLKRWIKMYIDSHRATPLELRPCNAQLPCDRFVDQSVIHGGCYSSFSFDVAAATVLSASSLVLHYCCCCCYCCLPMLLLSADWTALRSADQ